MRVVIAEDSALLREGVARILAEGDFEVLAQCVNADELLDAVRRHKPEVAVVDVRMPPSFTDEGARAAREIREQHPEIGVLLLSQIVEAAHALALFSERPDGFGCDRSAFKLFDGAANGDFRFQADQSDIVQSV